MRLKQLSLVLGSYECDKACRHCNAKSHTNFVSEDDRLDLLPKHLFDFEKLGYSFNRFVISGNGEPSLYPIETFETITDSVQKHRKMFDQFEIHTSGRLFREDAKIELLREKFGDDLVVTITIDDLRESNEPDYMKLKQFMKTQNVEVKLLTSSKMGELRYLVDRLEEFNKKHPNTSVKLTSDCRETSCRADIDWWQFRWPWELWHLDDELKKNGHGINDIFEKGKATGLLGKPDYSKNIVIAGGELKGGFYIDKPELLCNNDCVKI
ncbi:MAG: radical SAM protein [Firmicutes bacterium]|nr:radical SAM protein [Bacillota bacterium]